MILLDTHVFLWLSVEPHRIGPTATTAIVRSSDVRFSSLTIAELNIKHMLGKLEVPSELHTAAAATGVTELPLTTFHSQAIREFPKLTGHDPFDRLLMAQALVERADFLTADRRLLALSLPWVLDARA